MAHISPPPTLGPIAELDFFDERSIELPRAIDALTAWNLIMSEPQPVMALAFRIRDAISARFGVRQIGGFSGKRHETAIVGEYLDFFLVEHSEPDLLVLTERDRHLDVMTSVSTSGRVLTITSSVVTHNAFGRAYMLPVGPAHKLIVTTMLRRVRKRLMETQTRR